MKNWGVKKTRRDKVSIELFEDFKNHVCNEVEAHVFRAVKQIEAHTNLIARLNDGISLPPMRSWAISPDFGCILINILDSASYDLILEFGSGVSTFIIAALLGKQNSYPSLQSHLAFDHLEKFQLQTKQSLKRLANSNRTDVWYCPLVEISVPDGTEDSYKYYDFIDRLDQHLGSLNRPINRVLLLVDGPPGSIGRCSRYPALPLILDILPNIEIDVVLDDYDRLDEKEIGDAWIDMLYKKDYQVETIVPVSEKGTLVIKASKSRL